jgi:hypothetical protein
MVKIAGFKSFSESLFKQYGLRKNAHKTMARMKIVETFCKTKNVQKIA